LVFPYVFQHKLSRNKLLVPVIIHYICNFDDLIQFGCEQELEARNKRFTHPVGLEQILGGRHHKSETRLLGGPTHLQDHGVDCVRGTLQLHVLLLAHTQLAGAHSVGLDKLADLAVHAVDVQPDRQSSHVGHPQCNHD